MKMVDTIRARIAAMSTFSHKAPPPPVPSAIWQRPLYFFAFGFGSGAFPFAPGTAGTLLAIPFYLLLAPLPWYAYLIIVSLFIGFSAWASERVSQEIQFHDHPGMCIDEFAGLFVTLFCAPPGWGFILLGFVLFRFFDIVKPWPIGWIDKKVKGGIGMILDDVVAGLFSLIILQLVALLFHSPT